MVPVVEAEELAKLDKSPNNPETRVTPHLISRLAAGEMAEANPVPLYVRASEAELNMRPMENNR